MLASRGELKPSAATSARPPWRKWKEDAARRVWCATKGPTALARRISPFLHLARKEPTQEAPGIEPRGVRQPVAGELPSIPQASPPTRATSPSARASTPLAPPGTQQQRRHPGATPRQQGPAPPGPLVCAHG